MEKIACTVGILTRNSAKTLRRALESVSEFDEILICDGGSSDDTLQLAREFGCRILEQDSAFTDEQGRITDYAGVRNQCLDAAQYSWFLYIDSDEAASPNLVEQVRAVVDSDAPCAGYRIPERMIVMERLIEYSSNYPGYQYRLLRTDKGTRFYKPVHERPIFLEPPSKQCTLTGPWYVFWGHDDVYRYMERNRKYISLQVARTSDRSVGAFCVRYFPHNARSIAGITIRTIIARLSHPAKQCMPLAVEWGRVRYHIELLVALFPKTL